AARQRFVREQARDDLAVLRGHLAPRLRSELLDDGRLGLRNGGALRADQQRANHVGGGAERLALAVRFATLKDDSRSVRPGRDAREHFSAEPRLAYARGAGDADEDRRVIPGGSLEGARHLRELGVSPDERR